jgi:hypothetical protein
MLLTEVLKAVHLSLLSVESMTFNEAGMEL